MIEKGLKDFILGLGEITQLIDDRYYPLVLPKNCNTPAITYQRISNTRHRSHSGYSMNSPVFQLSCWAETMESVRILAQKLIDAVDNHTGQMTPVERVTALHINDQDLYDPETGLYHIPIDFELNFT